MLKLTDVLGYPVYISREGIVGLNICQQKETEWNLNDMPHVRITTVGGHQYVVEECMADINHALENSHVSVVNNCRYRDTSICVKKESV